MQNFKTFLESRSVLIEEQLDKLVPEKDCSYGILFQAARYSLLGGGKRLRPLLTLATAETFGVSYQSAIAPACALEMIHTYSLIHDDLPCMDNDDFRRGKPSLHKAYSEDLAVLAGDFLLTNAFKVIAQTSSLSDSQKIKLVNILSSRAGGDGMIGGQVMDVEAGGNEINLELLEQLHQHKTGALLSAALEFGAVIANLSEMQIQKLQQFGFEIGLAFQIIDDVLDVTASQTHGKKIASDVINGKTTYVTLLGVEESQIMADALLKSALKKLDSLSEDGDIDVSLLKEIAHWIVKRTI